MFFLDSAPAVGDAVVALEINQSLLLNAFRVSELLVRDLLTVRAKPTSGRQKHENKKFEF